MNLIGQSIGRYHIIEQIGEGGMAIVYKAYDTHLDRNVAIKIIRKEIFGQAVLERVVQRFEREGKALAKLSNAHIVHVYDFGEFEGSPYLVMEYVEAGTLKSMMGKPFAWQDAVKIILPVAKALGYAHQRGIIHRDVKPSNILINSEGEPLLTDFGIAKLLEGEDGNTLTGAGVGIGTPEYMAPEQGVGAKDVDNRADIYSLGVVLYELLTGQKPYTAETPMAVVIMQARDPLPDPHRYVPDLPDAVANILFKALAKSPEDRYKNAGELTAAFQNLFKTSVNIEEIHATTSSIQTQIESKQAETVILVEEILPTNEITPNPAVNGQAAPKTLVTPSTLETIDNLSSSAPLPDLWTKETMDDLGSHSAVSAASPQSASAKPGPLPSQDLLTPMPSVAEVSKKPSYQKWGWIAIGVVTFIIIIFAFINSANQTTGSPISHSFSVDAMEQWHQISTYYYTAGSTFRITYQSGTWGAWPGSYSTPLGLQTGDPGYLLSEASVTALVCRVNDSPLFLVETGHAYHVDYYGYIYCQINDTDLSDNHGTVNFWFEAWD